MCHQANKQILTFARMMVSVHDTHTICLNAHGKSTEAQNEAIHSTQRGEGFQPHVKLCIKR